MLIQPTRDGSHTLLSEQFGTTYHSSHGAITESHHVFIAAGLHASARWGSTVDVLETGFGTGLNAWMTALEAARTGCIVRYTALEMYPVPLAVAHSLNYPELLGCPEQAEEFSKLHRQPWGQMLPLHPHFFLEKRQQPIQHLTDQAAFDVVYFDVFAPQVQPELWTADTLGRLYVALRASGYLVTYGAQGEFRRTLRAVGFEVEKLPGPPGKREMTRAHKPDTSSDSSALKA